MKRCGWRHNYPASGTRHSQGEASQACTVPNRFLVVDTRPQVEVPECPQRHWSVGAGWEMAESMAHVLGEHTKNVMG
jgi:hypothetical protein